MNTFEKVMAENAIFRGSACQRSFKGVKIINPLSDIGAFSKKILVNIRNRECIGIDACRS